jgi:hypothetical protein
MALRWRSAVTQNVDWPEYNEGNRHQFKKYHRAGERHSSHGRCQSNDPQVAIADIIEIIATALSFTTVLSVADSEYSLDLAFRWSHIADRQING